MLDVISAISTAHGAGGVAIIRLSGQNALEIAEKMLSPAGKTGVKDFIPNVMATSKATALKISECAFISRRPNRLRARTWWNFTVTAGCR